MSDVDDYDYFLPRELIAQHPLPQRTDARLLVVERKTKRFTHSHVRDLAEWLTPDDALVLNNTGVVPAQLVGRRTFTGGRWQGLFLSADERGMWRLLCKARGKLKAGEKIALFDRLAREDVSLVLMEQGEEGVWTAQPLTDESHWAVLERAGRVPLPPYIRGGRPVAADQEQYQTVYAATPGAIAAPTAGLHFTQELLVRLELQGIAVCRATLHVGIGTFRPIASGTLAEHHMHREWGTLDAATVATLLDRRSRGGRIVAVGTTTVRLLETAARDGGLKPWTGETDLFIRPPFPFRATDALLTNFHLPRSTLLVMVRTFGGDELIRQAYAEAIREEYRFFSYGDAMLIV